MTRRLAHVCATGATALAVVAGFAVTASADSPNNSAQGSVTYFAALGTTDIHVAFSAGSDQVFQASHGADGSAQGMINFQPSSQSDTVDPALGRVSVSCLNVVGNEAFMTGTASEPISSNAFTGAPHFLPPNEWIVGGWLSVLDNGGTGSDRTGSGFFLNADKNHVISTPRCFGSLPGPSEPIENGHVNVYSAAP